MATGWPVADALPAESSIAFPVSIAAHRTPLRFPVFCQEEKALKEMKSTTTHYRVLAIGKDKARPPP